MAENKQEPKLYDRLRSLFSTGVVVRPVSGKKLKVIDTDRVRAVDRSRKVRSSLDSRGSINYGSQQRQYNLALRKQYFLEYEQMDRDGILSSALDIVADESVTKNEYGEVLKIDSDDENIKEILENLFYDVLNVDYNLWLWIRSMAKYGDHFLELVIKEKMGVIGFETLNVYNVERVEKEDNDGILRTIFRDNGNPGSPVLQSFEVAHFKLLNDPNFFPYGRSFYEPARREWKRLNLMEDAMMVQRIMRAPERRVFKIDVGNMPPTEIDAYMEKLMSSMKKIPYIDPQTGEYNLRFNMENILEDYYIPVRGNASGDNIETLPGLQTFQIEDIEYLRDKMLAALKIPKAFLNYTEDMNGKASLAQSDVRFSRTIERIQLLAIDTLKKIAMVHLYSQGYENEELVNFELSLTLPSTLAEREKLDLLTEKFRLATDAKNSTLVSSAWIAEHVFNMTAEEFSLERKRLKYDADFQKSLEATEMGAQAGSVDELPEYPGDNTENDQNVGEAEVSENEIRNPDDELGHEDLATSMQRARNQQYKPVSTFSQRKEAKRKTLVSFLQELENSDLLGNSTRINEKK